MIPEASDQAVYIPNFYKKLVCRLFSKYVCETYIVNFVPIMTSVDVTHDKRK